MPELSSIMAELRVKGTEKARKTYVRHGMPPDRVFGVSVSDLKIVAKTIRGRQALAADLYQTGIMEAMYLAGMVADGALMKEEQLQQWADGSQGMPMIAEYTVPWVTVESPQGRVLATQWIGSTKEQVASAGWCTWSGILATQPDRDLDLAEVQGLLQTVVTGIDGAQNRVRATMNGFVISTGAHVLPLLQQAKAAARKIGPVSIDVGDTACKIRVSLEEIEKIEKMGKAGVKRKSIRC